MLSIPGNHGRDCDGVTRRELLRIGGSAMLGLMLPEFLALEARADKSTSSKGKGGFGQAKSVILLYLQGGPSHIDIWDPKPDAPANVRGEFKPIPTKIPGVQVSETMPLLAQQLDKATLIRSVSYTPNGLFNHTAAMYQMLTGEQADRVSPSGQLEPPAPSDYPNLGSHISKFLPPEVPMLPFVMMPRPLQESNVIGKAGTAGFLGKAYDPYYLYPPGDDMDMTKMDRIKIDDLRLRDEISAHRLERRAKIREQIDHGMPALEQAIKKYDLDAYYGKALGLVISGRARNAFDLTQEPAAMRDRYGKNTFGQCCLLARRLIEAGTRFVEINWPKVANSDNHSWDVHVGLSKRMKNQSAPMLDGGLSTLIADLDERGLLAETLVVAVGEFGRSPQRGVSTSGNDNQDDGRDHWPYCYTGVIAGAGTKRGLVYGKSDKTASAPVDNPVHPRELLATIYHSVGIDPATMVLNHLNQPRELVQGDTVTGILS